MARFPATMAGEATSPCDHDASRYASARRRHAALLPMAQSSCSDVEDGIDSRSLTPSQFDRGSPRRGRLRMARHPLRVLLITLVVSVTGSRRATGLPRCVRRRRGTGEADAIAAGRGWGHTCWPAGWPWTELVGLVAAALDARGRAGEVRFPGPAMTGA